MRYRGIIGWGIAALLASSVASQAQAQAGGFSDVPSAHWAASSVDRLVSQGILAAPQQKSGAKAAPKYDGNKAVTRYELAVALDRFVQYVERADKQKKTKFNVQATPASGAAAAKRLVANGYLPANSPLLKDNTKVVTARQLASALSATLVKITEKRTPISPDSQFAPERPGESAH